MEQNCWNCKKILYRGDGVYGACHSCAKTILWKAEKKLKKAGK